MAADSIRFTDLRDDLSFGARVWGATRDNLKDEANREKVRQAFEDRGLLVFEEVEQSGEMQLAISEVLGPLKDHPVKAVARADASLAPGVIEISADPDDQTIVDLDGKRLSNWLPWHFDHAYNNELNRAGVLRPMVVAPDGGLTGFADGIGLYESLAPELRRRIEGLNVVYHLGTMITNMRFGKPNALRQVWNCTEGIKVEEGAKKVPRAIHPAVWTRRTGEKVLHVGMLHAVGIEGHEDAEGNDLLEAVCRHVAANPKAYYHQWKLGQMLTWDNWRILHSVTGTDPSYGRRMHRTTIKGDYGLGYFEGSKRAEKVPERAY